MPYTIDELQALDFYNNFRNDLRAEHINKIVDYAKNKFRDETVGPYAALGGPFYIKKILGKSHYLIKASESFYHEVTPQCFEQTIKRSTVLDTNQIKKNLEAFNAK